MYGFLRGLGTMNCLAAFIGPIYRFFCCKEFLSAAFIEVKRAYDSVHIPTLLYRLVEISLPSKLYSLIQTLFSHRLLHFISPSGQEVVPTTYRGLPQGSCLIPILFNIYSSFISKKLSESDFNDIIIFSCDICRK